MADIQIPVASPRKSVKEIPLSKIMVPEIKVDALEDTVTEVAREILEETMEENENQEVQAQVIYDNNHDENETKIDNVENEEIHGNEEQSASK